MLQITVVFGILESVTYHGFKDWKIRDGMFIINTTEQQVGFKLSDVTRFSVKQSG